MLVDFNGSNSFTYSCKYAWHNHTRSPRWTKQLLKRRLIKRRRKFSKLIKKPKKCMVKVKPSSYFHQGIGSNKYKICYLYRHFKYVIRFMTFENYFTYAKALLYLLLNKKQPLWLFFKIGVLKTLSKFTRKHLFRSCRSATLLKNSDPEAGVFLWVLRKL